MSANLLIVESPAKARTINKYLGKDFIVMASYGHVRDLVPRDGAVDTASDFAMNYEVIDKNARHVDAIAKATRKADAIYLATDLDREGEAISWHVYELLKERGVLDSKKVHRVVFGEITPRAIKQAVAEPRDISMDLVNAQQARRALDYLVGFNLSPLLWKKVRRGLSAGRVQTPALRMIVEREEEIERFESREYWTIEADLEKEEQPFTSKLVEYRGSKLDQFDIGNEDQAKAIREELIEAAGGRLQVSDLTSRERKRHPPPPFITSTLQQEAVRKLRFSAQKAMRVAQQLYEGIDIGGQTQGLITYMRTDSVSLSSEALDDLRAVIAEDYGADKRPERPNFYKTKSKNAQEAHEAVRPTDPRNRPQALKAHLSSDQYRLYQLIWNRAVACQMKPARINVVSVTLPCGEGTSFRASGSTVIDPGFLVVYDERREDKAAAPKLPPLEKGEWVNLSAIRSEQHFTEPPPRYSEATLVKALEEYGIGRPSTYAAIIQTLMNREYVELENRRFVPTDVGRVVSKFLSEHFSRYVDYDFTARLEDELDAVSRGETDWVPLLRSFWDPFSALVKDKEESVTRADVLQVRELGTDPESGKPMSVRMGRYGPYVQIGTKDDDEKPRFAGLRPGQKMDSITLEEALELFKLPRELGLTPDGKPVSVNIGRYGPYVRYGNKFVSINPPDDPYSIPLERALELVAEKQKADANKTIQAFEGSDIKVLRGRYGPYVTDGKKNGRIPKGREPESLTLDECREILAAAPERRRRAKKKGGGRKSA